MFTIMMFLFWPVFSVDPFDSDEIGEGFSGCGGTKDVGGRPGEIQTPCNCLAHLLDGSLSEVKDKLLAETCWGSDDNIYNGQCEGKKTRGACESEEDAWDCKWSRPFRESYATRIPLFPERPPYTRKWSKIANPKNMKYFLADMQAWWSGKGCASLKSRLALPDAMILKTEKKEISKLGISFTYGSGTTISIGIDVPFIDAGVNFGFMTEITGVFFVYRDIEYKNVWKCGYEVILNQGGQKGGEVGLSMAPTCPTATCPAVGVGVAASFDFGKIMGLITPQYKKMHTNAHLKKRFNVTLGINGSDYGGIWMGAAFGSTAGSVAEAGVDAGYGLGVGAGVNIFSGESYGYYTGWPGYHEVQDTSWAKPNFGSLKNDYMLNSDGCGGARRYFHKDCWNGITMVNVVTTWMSPQSNLGSLDHFGYPIVREFECGSGWDFSATIAYPPAGVGGSVGCSNLNYYWDNYAWDIPDTSLTTNDGTDIGLTTANDDRTISYDRNNWYETDVVTRKRATFKRLHWKHCKSTWTRKGDATGWYWENDATFQIQIGTWEDAQDSDASKAADVECDDDSENDIDGDIKEVNPTDGSASEVFYATQTCRFTEPYTVAEMVVDVEKGTGSCVECTVGKKLDVQYVRLCMDCAIGKYQDTRNQIECKTCPDGWYQNRAGKTECHEIPNGWVGVTIHGEKTRNSTILFTVVPLQGDYVRENSMYELVAVCPPGEIRKNGECVNCPGYIATAYNSSNTFPFTVTDLNPTGDIWKHHEEFKMDDWLNKYFTERIFGSGDVASARITVLKKRFKYIMSIIFGTDTSFWYKLLSHYGPNEKGWLGFKLETVCFGCPFGWKYDYGQKKMCSSHWRQNKRPSYKQKEI